MTKPKVVDLAGIKVVSVALVGILRFSVAIVGELKE